MEKEILFLIKTLELFVDRYLLRVTNLLITFIQQKNYFAASNQRNTGLNKVYFQLIVIIL